MKFVVIIVVIGILFFGFLYAKEKGYLEKVQTKEELITSNQGNDVDREASLENVIVKDGFSFETIKSSDSNKETKTAFGITFDIQDKLSMMTEENSIQKISFLDKNKSGFLSIERYLSKEDFDKYLVSINDPNKGWSLQEGNYLVGGEKAIYYRGDLGQAGEGNYINGIVIPSKLVSINALHMPNYLVSDMVINQIIASIKFNY